MYAIVLPLTQTFSKGRMYPQLVILTACKAVLNIIGNTFTFTRTLQGKPI